MQRHACIWNQTSIEGNFWPPLDARKFCLVLKQTSITTSIGAIILPERLVTAMNSTFLTLFSAQLQGCYVNFNM